MSQSQFAHVEYRLGDTTAMVVFEYHPMNIGVVSSLMEELQTSAGPAFASWRLWDVSSYPSGEFGFGGFIVGVICTSQNYAQVTAEIVKIVGQALNIEFRLAPILPVPPLVPPFPTRWARFRHTLWYAGGSRYNTWRMMHYQALRPLLWAVRMYGRFVPLKLQHSINNLVERRRSTNQ